ncbi:adenylate/guanylate cyclase domain-containing protein [Chelatococcus sp. SYSU_G07232]|uniref:Adenylate/guanylate cyclase domain-containing protein n=1 Tax=Chelatococcus albus TaxID=3047466 RepID=A0ABT7AFN0_9HYPH|nr:adenylate/guanylate cyclase domain-containing protein [Chelatococcus sp. SYSU_G07232]MDJ1158164.1 adenylate/guanylate cyclase domain-containing protein [Chelatococcus sp. SYSU_G07232]
MISLAGWAALYFALSLAADRLAGGPDGVVAVWPAAGLALFLTLSYGRRGLLPIAIGAFLSAAPAWASPGMMLVQILLGAASLAGAVAGAGAYDALADHHRTMQTIGRLRPGHPFRGHPAAPGATRAPAGAGSLMLGGSVFAEPMRMIALLVGGGLGFSLVGAAVGTLVLHLSNAFPGSERLADLPGRFTPWFIADLAGAVLVAPFLIAWSESGPWGRVPAAVAALWAGLIAVSLGALATELPPNLENATVLLLLGPALAAAAFTTSARAFTTILLTGATMALAVVLSHDPDKPTEAEVVTLLLVQLYIVSISFTHLILYAAIAENRRSIAERVNLAKHFSPNMVELIAKLGRPFEKPRRQVATVLFCDLRNFTSLSERAGPEATMELLRAFHRTMSDIVFAHGGTLDRYIGDGLMAVFGVPEPAPDDALRALRCAEDMTAALAALNDRRRSRDLPPLDMGIGLHTGEVVLGEIGSESTLSVTVVGDTVNAASRLQALSREIGAAIVMSNETLGAAKALPAARELALVGHLAHVGHVHLRGRRQETDTWALMRPAASAPPAAASGDASG